MGRFLSKKKLVAGGVVLMSTVALVFTVLTLQGILALGSGQERTQDDAVGEEEKAIRTAADGNWGLSFQNKGSAPTANATSEYLKKYNAYYIGNEKSKEKTIYLTFDAGYENGYTAVLLDVLKEEKVPAAFFVVGNFIEENPELVKRMTAEGHIVGNHTVHHPDMSAIADEAGFRKEMSELEDAYRAATGEKMLKFYRPPQGKYSEKNLEMANAMGYTTVFWSLAYVDWLQDSQPSREDAPEPAEQTNSSGCNRASSQHFKDECRDFAGASAGLEGAGVHLPFHLGTRCGKSLANQISKSDKCLDFSGIRESE